MIKKEGIVDSEEDSDKQNVSYADRDEKCRQIIQSSLSEDEKKREIEAYYPGFWIVRVLAQGESFGEIALQKYGERYNI